MLWKLAILYQKQSKYAEAELSYLRALHIREQQLGSNHSEVGNILCGFAFLQQAQGKLEDALSSYQRALTIHEHVFGLLHPKTKATQRGLLSVLQALGQHDEAASLQAILAESTKREDEQEEHQEE